MKPAYYMLSVVLLVLAALVITLSALDRRAPNERDQADVRVYVDLDRLLSKHPVGLWLQTGSTKELRGSKAYSKSRLAADLLFPTSDSDLSSLPLVATLKELRATAMLHDASVRQQLELAAARAEVAALHKLESNLYQALWARIQVKRAEMTASVAERTDALVREVQIEESEQRRQADERTAIDRINAMLKLQSLQVATKVPGVEEKILRAAISLARDQWSILEDQRAVERKRIRQEARSQIESIEREAADAVSTALSSYEISERSRIESSIGRARSTFVSELGETVLPVRSVTVRDDTPAGRQVVAESYLEVVPGEPASADILKALRAGIKRGVALIARERGLRVVFDRGQGLPDATDMMLRLLSERGLAGWGAVGYAVGRT